MNAIVQTNSATDGIVTLTSAELDLERSSGSNITDANAPVHDTGGSVLGANAGLTALYDAEGNYVGSYGFDPTSGYFSAWNAKGKEVSFQTLDAARAVVAGSTPLDSAGKVGLIYNSQGQLVGVNVAGFSNAYTDGNLQSQSVVGVKQIRDGSGTLLGSFGEQNGSLVAWDANNASIDAKALLESSGFSSSQIDASAASMTLSQGVAVSADDKEIQASLDRYFLSGTSQTTVDKASASTIVTVGGADPRPSVYGESDILITPDTGLTALYDTSGAYVGSYGVDPANGYFSAWDAQGVESSLQTLAQASSLPQDVAPIDIGGRSAVLFDANGHVVGANIGAYVSSIPSAASAGQSVSNVRQVLNANGQQIGSFGTRDGTIVMWDGSGNYVDATSFLESAGYGASAILEVAQSSDNGIADATTTLDRQNIAATLSAFFVQQDTISTYAADTSTFDGVGQDANGNNEYDNGYYSTDIHGGGGGTGLPPTSPVDVALYTFKVIVRRIVDDAGAGLAPEDHSFIEVFKDGQVFTTIGAYSNGHADANGDDGELVYLRDSDIIDDNDPAVPNGFDLDVPSSYGTDQRVASTAFLQKLLDAARAYNSHKPEAYNPTGESNDKILRNAEFMSTLPQPEGGVMSTAEYALYHEMQSHFPGQYNSNSFLAGLLDFAGAGDQVAALGNTFHVDGWDQQIGIDGPKPCNIDVTGWDHPLSRADFLPNVKAEGQQLTGLLNGVITAFLDQTGGQIDLSKPFDLSAKNLADANLRLTLQQISDIMTSLLDATHGGDVSADILKIADALTARDPNAHSYALVATSIYNDFKMIGQGAESTVEGILLIGKDLTSVDASMTALNQKFGNLVTSVNQDFVLLADAGQVFSGGSDTLEASLALGRDFSKAFNDVQLSNDFSDALAALGALQKIQRGGVVNVVTGTVQLGNDLVQAGIVDAKSQFGKWLTKFGGGFAAGLAGVVGGFEQGGVIGGVEAGYGAFLMGPALGIAASGLLPVAIGVALISAIFGGNHDNPANMPDKYDTDRFGQDVADLEGASQAVGVNFAEDAPVKALLGGRTGIAGIEETLAHYGTKDNAPDWLKPMWDNLMNMFGSSATGSGVLQFDHAINNEHISGATGTDGQTYQYTDLANAVYTFASALSQATGGLGLAAPATTTAPASPTYGGLDWTPMTLSDGSTGYWSDAGNGQYYFFGSDNTLYLDNYPGEVHSGDSGNAVGNVTTYVFPSGTGGYYG